MLIDVNSHISISPSNQLTQKNNVYLPLPGNFDRPDLYTMQEANPTYCWGILVILKEWISSKPSDRTKMKYKKTRHQSWWYIAEGRLWHMANGKSYGENRAWFQWWHACWVIRVNLLNNQKLLCRLINKTVFFGRK